MKQPFWILNSSLLLALAICLMVIFLSSTTLSTKKSIEPTQQEIQEKPTPPINASIVYENDLFGTYSMQETPPPATEKPLVPKLPPAPQQVVVPVPTEQPDTFLEPLAISLTGTITLTDDTKNKAIVLDTKTKTQASYRVGDEIEDAQLIRIFRNKAIFLRSNGQQETIFLDQDEALLNDPVVDWKKAIEKISDTEYLIELKKFVQKINNISEFINQMNLMTAFKDGKTVGIRVGAAQKESIGPALGFKAGDLIVSVNEIPASNTEEIYNNIKKQKENSTITVTITRDNQNIRHTYKLKDVVFWAGKKPKGLEKRTDDELEGIRIDHSKVEQEKLKILRNKYEFAPTAFELKMKEEQNIKKLAGR